MHGLASRDLKSAAELVPGQRNHGFGEINPGEDMPVCRGPLTKQLMCLADPVGGLVKVTKTDQDHGLSPKGEEHTACHTDAFRQLEVVVGTSLRGLPIRGQNVDNHKQASLDYLECWYPRCTGQAERFLRRRPRTS
jgi:hypothetical protein